MKLNSKAPIFDLPSTSNEKYFLKNSVGNYVVLYFYPKDDTPGCINQGGIYEKNNSNSISIIPILISFR